MLRFLYTIKHSLTDVRYVDESEEKRRQVY